MTLLLQNIFPMGQRYGFLLVFSMPLKQIEKYGLEKGHFRIHTHEF